MVGRGGRVIQSLFAILISTLHQCKELLFERVGTQETILLRHLGAGIYILSSRLVVGYSQ